MTEEPLVAPAETTQNTPSADVASPPEVASPETLPEAQTDQQEAKPEDAAKKVHDATQRRINRLVAMRAQERAQRQLLEQRLAQFERPEPADEQRPAAQQRQFGPDDVRREAAALNEAQRFVSQCNALVSEGRKAFKDFDANLQTLALDVGPLLNERGQAEPLLQAVLTTDRPHEVLRHLALNPDVAADLADLPPLQQARKLALIEAQMKTPARQPSAAPLPLTPIKAAADSSGEPDPGDTARWIAWRNKQTAPTR